MEVENYLHIHAKLFKKGIYSEELEQYILGVFILDKEVRNIHLPWYSKSHFFNLNHQIIFDTIEQLCFEQSCIDLLEVGLKLDKSKNLKKIGGFNYLAKILEIATDNTFKF